MSLAKLLDLLWGTTQPAIQWVPLALSAEVKRPGFDANHSPSFSARVKKKWSCISTPHVYLNGVYSDNFSFLPHYDFLLRSGDRTVSLRRVRIQRKHILILRLFARLLPIA